MRTAKVEIDGGPEQPGKVPAHVALLQQKLAVIRQPLCAKRLWDRQFSNAERELLGGDFDEAYRTHKTIGMWVRVRGGSADRAVADIAFALNLLTQSDHRWAIRELGEEVVDNEDAVENAIAAGCLVITEHPRTVHWQGQKTDVEWESKTALWNYFFELARSAKEGRIFDGMSLKEMPDAGALSKMRYRLKMEAGFPRSLVMLIRRAGRGSQKLQVDRSQIRIFVLESTDRLRELGESI